MTSPEIVKLVAPDDPAIWTFVSRKGSFITDVSYVREAKPSAIVWIRHYPPIAGVTAYEVIRVGLFTSAEEGNLFLTKVREFRRALDMLQST